MTLSLRVATQKDPGIVQKIFDLAPDYTRRVEGRDPQPDEGEQMFAALPPNKTKDDKFIYILEADSEAVGCVDVIRLSVVMTNAQVVPFWKKRGFNQLGELRPYNGAAVETTVMIMEKILCT